jgi:ParB family chromosome partitioning protein
MSRLKAPDIQQAKKAPDTSALESQIAALESERDTLQAQLDTAEAVMADTPDPSLWESLKLQLVEAEATRQAYADELARLKAQGPVERIVEKVVTVEKPVSDPAQAERIATLESTLSTTQAELTLLKTRRKDLQNFQQERDKLDREINDIKNELARLRDSTNVARYRLTQAAAISQILKKILKDGLSEIPQLEALLADSQGTIFQTDRDLALTVAQQLQQASDLILTAVKQFEDPIIYDVTRYHSEADPDHPVTKLLKEAQVLNDHNSIVSPTD